MRRRGEMVRKGPWPCAVAAAVTAACAGSASGDLVFEVGDDVRLPAQAQVVIGVPLREGAGPSVVGLHTTLSRCTVAGRDALATDSGVEAFASGLAPRGVAAADLDGDRDIDLADAIRALQVAAGIDADGVEPHSDVDGDGRIGLAEALFSLKAVQ